MALRVKAYWPKWWLVELMSQTKGPSSNITISRSFSPYFLGMGRIHQNYKSLTSIQRNLAELFLMLVFFVQECQL